MPTFFQDHFITVGPRAWSFAMYSTMGMTGDNDAIFKETIFKHKDDDPQI